MATKRTSRQVLRNAQLIMTATSFENGGDSVTSTMNITTSTLDKSVYVRRHVITKGHFTVSFPGTDTPSESGGAGDGLDKVFPKQDSYVISSSTFVVTANEPNSEYYCVFPIYPGDNIGQVTTELSAGEQYVVNTRSVAFVYGDDFSVNGARATANPTVLACEHTSATITANTLACEILQFGVPAL